MTDISALVLTVAISTTLLVYIATRRAFTSENLVLALGYDGAPLLTALISSTRVTSAGFRLNGITDWGDRETSSPGVETDPVSWRGLGMRS